MRTLSRREFLQSTGAAALALSAGGRLAGAARRIPIGLELYTVHTLLQKDFDGTLRQAAAIGFQEVELYSFLGRTAAQIRHSLEAAGVSCVSALWGASELQPHLERTIDDAHRLGLGYIVCDFPTVADPGRFHLAPGDQGGFIRDLWTKLTLDDWRWNAELFNRMGERVRRAGLTFCYHNNNYEFRRYGYVTGYDVLMERCEPALVKFELDAGWAVRAGVDPVELMGRAPGRFPLLHVKDIRRGLPPSTGMGTGAVTELGRGKIDFQRLFAAAPAAGVQYAFLDQETFTVPILEGLREDYAFLKAHPV